MAVITAQLTWRPYLRHISHGTCWHLPSLTTIIYLFADSHLPIPLSVIPQANADNKIQAWIGTFCVVTGVIYE